MDLIRGGVKQGENDAVGEKIVPDENIGRIAQESEEKERQGYIKRKMDHFVDMGDRNFRPSLGLAGQVEKIGQIAEERELNPKQRSEMDRKQGSGLAGI